MIFTGFAAISQVYLGSDGDFETGPKTSGFVYN